MGKTAWKGGSGQARLGTKPQKSHLSSQPIRSGPVEDRQATDRVVDGKSLS